MFFTVKLSLVAISRTNKRKETTSLNQRASGTSEYAAYDDAARLELRGIRRSQQYVARCMYLVFITERRVRWFTEEKRDMIKAQRYNGGIIFSSLSASNTRALEKVPKGVRNVRVGRLLPVERYRDVMVCLVKKKKKGKQRKYIEIYSVYIKERKRKKAGGETFERHVWKFEWNVASRYNS